ncbi:MAG: glycoside hydrolase family 43 protein [Clostridiales bacterium]|nr:glycoside hydrolase family 43 protein [Clostridiales bacterium]
MKYMNPIIKGFSPDPSICRVGNDYYLVTSTFEYFPAIPIYHSTDLVNWMQIGNCIERPQQLPFDIAEAGQGVWAPTIRYFNGKFYVTASFMGFGNFIISSENPASDWSEPVKVNINGIDPSILFDNGNAYYCTNARGKDDREAISAVQINVDTGEMLGNIRQIWNGGSNDQPQYLEAPHIYHIGEWYYLLAAEGGTKQNHMITCARSKNIWGPYENCPHNPILTGRYDITPEAACSGHGDLVDDQNGNWWCVHLATRPDDEWYSHMGRETFLLPVVWENEWPVIADGKPHLEYDAPLWNEQREEKSWTADFSKIESRWLFLRKPENYILSDGRLMLMPSAVKISDTTDAPAMMLIRQPDIECSISAEIDFTPVNNGDEAGMTIYISNKGYYTFSKIRSNNRNYIVISKNDSSFEPIYREIESGRLTLQVNATKENYDFYYALNNGEYIYAGQVPVLTRVDAGKGFTGTLIGVFTQCDMATDANMQVFNFKSECGVKAYGI